MTRAASVMAVLAAGIAILVGSVAPGKAPTKAPAAGERIFQRCYSCHSLNKGERGLTGPNLDQIVGRRIASDPDFNYSPAFRRFAAREKVWTRTLLDRFIANPQEVVPGNEMQYFGLDRDEERAALVAYLFSDR